MARQELRLYGAGVLTGAGLSLLALYVLAQAVPINLEQWPRIAVGAVGLVLAAVGFFLRPRPPSPKERPGA
jgi:hypothetical protein